MRRRNGNRIPLNSGAPRIAAIAALATLAAFFAIATGAYITGALAEPAVATGGFARAAPAPTAPDGASDPADCPAHPAHDADCGFAAGDPGASCAHAHELACYVVTLSCLHPHEDGCYGEQGETRCPHLHGSKCYPRELACRHIHGAGCGFAEPAEGSPCLHRCAACDGSVKTAEWTVEIEVALPSPSGGDAVNPRGAAFAFEIARIGPSGEVEAVYYRTLRVPIGETSGRAALSRLPEGDYAVRRIGGGFSETDEMQAAPARDDAESAVRFAFRYGPRGESGEETRASTGDGIGSSPRGG